MWRKNNSLVSETRRMAVCRWTWVGGQRVGWDPHQLPWIRQPGRLEVGEGSAEGESATEERYAALVCLR